MNVKLNQSEKLQQVLNEEEVYLVMQRILKRENKIDRDKEHFWTIGLNGGNQLLYVELISLGSSRMTLVEPMQVFRVGVLKGAVRLILVHNHPSGTLKPTDADKTVTDRLLQAGKILDIEVIDHLIITEESYYSFAGSGLLEELKKSTLFVPDYQLKAKLRKEVEEEVEKNKVIEIARHMKAKGFTKEQIAEVTGLSAKSIEKLKLPKDNT